MILTKIWFENDRIYGLTNEGKSVWQSLLWYKRLNAATEEQRNDYEINDGKIVRRKPAIIPNPEFEHLRSRIL